MPVTRSARKKMRQDKKRQATNLIVKNKVKAAIKDFRQKPDEKKLSQAFSLLDRAKKKHIFHANKVSRLKSRLTRLLSSGKKGATGKRGVAGKKKSSKRTSSKRTGSKKK